LVEHLLFSKLTKPNKKAKELPIPTLNKATEKATTDNLGNYCTTPFF